MCGQQRPVCVLAIFIRITQQKLAKTYQVAILDLVLARDPLALPVNGRLTYSIGKSKWFLAVQVRGCKAVQNLHAILPMTVLKRFDPALEVTRFRVEHGHHVWQRPGAAPTPIPGGVRADIPEPPRTAGVLRHAG